MPQILQFQNISKRYGPKILLDDASLVIHDSQKIGVIGRNGAGKSTLFNILTGKDEADSGTIHKKSNLRIGYLEQKDTSLPEETSLEFLMRLSEKEDWQCGKTAGRMQLGTDILNAKFSSLSGGFQMRLRLTLMLLFEPEFILLDEPTNYLDLKTLLLLEKFLLTYNGGFMVISHDREFLKKTCTETLEVDRGKLTLFPGRVEDYLEWKEEEKERIEKYNQGIESKQKDLQDFIDRFGAKASKATQAKSKVKALAKLNTIAMDHTLRNVKMHIPFSASQGKGIALKMEGLDIGYPQKKVAGNISGVFSKGEHIAVLGDNGEGKSTFLKTIYGNNPALGGSFSWGTGVVPGYFAQHVYSSLNDKDTVLTHLQKHAAKEIPQQQILDMAGSFLFSGDEVDKKVSILSGGERSRLLLCSLLLSGCNTLLLDEPTNHLDFETAESLAMALKKYPGTLLFISHDRTFVSQIANSILEVKNGQILHYPGSYEEYVYSMELQLEANEPANARNKGGSNNGKKIQNENAPINTPEKPKNTYQLKKELQSTLNKEKNLINKIETDMKSLEEKQKTLTSELASNYSQNTNQKLIETTLLLEDTEKTWMQLHEKIEKMKSELKELS